ncbi:MAG: adenine phosphoribosyltransferase [Candidatus Muiribacterium halophilum]|uniref:Adenine phosphoribosyltransferase n=1 Tax=Muiribacterium halophilum TaxID=2053465 RepID=A0A2N5ZEF2_MUIH1|nr:MAG: adenine phosphoribosyltransferase [Candidatus Muirbacterium halophilum]
MNYEKLIRDIPDFPKKGIVFKDITPVLKDHSAFKKVVEEMAEPFKDSGIDYVVGMESRGFIFGVPVSQILGAGFVPVRKPGKLPAKTASESYELEYGSDTLEIHEDAIEEGKKVLIVDDLLATGGTCEATIRLVEKIGGKVEGTSFFIELGFINGREKLKGYKVNSLINY